MIKFVQHKYLQLNGLTMAFLLSTRSAQAQQQISCDDVTSNLGEVAAELSCESGSLPILFTSTSYVLGVGFTIAGLLKMKEYVDNPSQSFMKDALIRLGVGSMLILLPFVIETSALTFGGEDTQAFDRQSLEVF